MDVIKLEQKNYFEVIMRTGAALRRGSVIAVPTDTVYGLAADATNNEAVRRLFEAKKREKDKPVPIFVDGMERAKRVAFIEEKALEDMLKKKWPGAFTAILYARKIVSPLARGRGGLTVGVRVPDHRFLRDVIRAFGKPVTGTSANLSGLRPATTAEKFSSRAIDMIIDGGICDGAPSTVVDFTVTPPAIIRN